jgi:hypothetical protein
VQIGIPYLAWTGIYVLFTILRPGGAWNHAGTYFWTDIRIGYYQLYVIIVLFQFYLVFPFLLKLLQSTSTRQHVVIMSISVAIALFIGVDLHYNPHLGVVGHDVHQIGNAWVWSRNLISYQVYFVAGALVAFTSRPCSISSAGGIARSCWRARSLEWRRSSGTSS